LKGCNKSAQGNALGVGNAGDKSPERAKQTVAEGQGRVPIVVELRALFNKHQIVFDEKYIWE
jgi:hypothetical protein